jgi:glycosyltransferase involved in cell wall biosynthesis
MRIAIIAEVFLPKIDGVVVRTVNLIDQLLRRGHEVVVVCPEVSEPRSSPVPLIEFPGFRCRSYPEYVIGRPDQRLVEELAVFRPDVIHYLNPFAFGFQCCDLLSRSRPHVPALFSFHTLYGEFVRQYRGLQLLSPVVWWLMRCYHQTADMNLTVSSVMTDVLRERGFPRVALWPPAVDSAGFCPQRRDPEMRRRLSGNHPEAPLLLTVSRLASEKNVGFLAEVLDRVPEARLAIVGGGPQRDELQRRFASRKAQFIGYLRGPDLAAAYASADAFIYASETETMGNVILEALASGLPVVAADAGGVPSLIRQGVDGYLYSPRNAREAAGFARQILESPERRQQMSAAAVESVQSRTWQDAALVVEQYYRQLSTTAQDSNAIPSRPHPAAGLCTRALVRLFQLASHRQIAPTTAIPAVLPTTSGFRPT